MRILLSGGIKTQNILKGIEKKFEASGDDFLVVEYLDDIQEIFGRGDYFDKALITEQSITREGDITDELEIRDRINKFAINMNSLPKKHDFVFLTSTEDMATIVHEEILPIIEHSIVILKQPKYAVSFFVEILVTDVKQLTADYVFTPSLVIPDDLESDITEGILDSFETEEESNIKLAPEDFDSELFGGLDTLGTESEVTSELDGNFGNNLDLSVTEDDIPIEETNDIEETEEEEIPDDDIEIYSPEESNILDKDEQIDLFNSEPVKQSNELPNYLQKVPVQPDMQEEDDEDFNNQDTGFIPGFDDAQTYDENNLSLIDNDMYSPDDNKQFDMSSTQEDFNGDYDENNFANGFGAELYNTPSNEQQDFGQYNQELGFNTDDYDTEEDIDSEYQRQMSDNMYNQDNQSGFNPQDYVEDDNSPELPQNMQNNTQIQPVQQPTGKKGLFGKLRGGQQNLPAQASMQQNISDVTSSSNVDRVRNVLQPFGARGNSILVTGCGGCGTSTISYNLANILSQLGFNVLLVDMDMEHKAQSYISKANYDSMDPDGSNLMSAVNSSNGINTYISVVKTGFHLLTMGLGADVAPINELLHKEKINRFFNLSKTSHNFIIYDVPFDTCVGYLSDITYMADNIVLVTDASNWGVTKTMLSMCNIVSDDMQEIMFKRAQLVFNKYRNLNRVLGNKVRTCYDITKVMDKKVLELIGEDTGLHFEEMHISGIINDDPDFENGWFEDVQYSDTKKGQSIFLDLIEKIIMNKN